MPWLAQKGVSYIPPKYVRPYSIGYGRPLWSPRGLCRAFFESSSSLLRVFFEPLPRGLLAERLPLHYTAHRSVHRQPAGGEALYDEPGGEQFPNHPQHQHRGGANYRLRGRRGAGPDRAGQPARRGRGPTGPPRCRPPLPGCPGRPGAAGAANRRRQRPALPGHTIRGPRRRPPLGICPTTRRPLPGRRLRPAAPGRWAARQTRARWPPAVHRPGGRPPGRWPGAQP